MIKNAITYTVEMPLTVSAMQAFMTKEMFAVKPTAMQLETFGFVKHPVSGESVTSFEGGYCLTFTHYKKKIDARAVTCEVNDIVEKHEHETGVQLKRADRVAIKEAVISKILPTILPTPNTIFAYYDVKSQTLVIDTTQDSVSDMCASHLRKAFGSLKATTLYIDPRAGLTEKLCNYLSSDSLEAEQGKVADFIPGIRLGSFLELTGLQKEKIVFKNMWLIDSGTSAEIAENISEANMYVKSLEMESGDVTFTLTDGFKFKAFHFGVEIDYDDDDDDDAYSDWQAETFYAVNQIVSITAKVCDAFTVVEGE